MNHCDECGADFYYAPANHRCPGEWEAMAGVTADAPTTTWVEECMAKQK